MYWTCKSCGTKNPENAKACGKCGGTTDAPRKFYAGSIFGAAVVFILMYVVGTSVGGTLVAFSLEPTDEQVLAMAKTQGSEEVSLMKIGPEDQDKAREAALEKARDQMSSIVRIVLFWFFPLILFPVIGAAVGFISQGRTVLEAAIGSVVGQVIGFLGMRFMYKVMIHPIELGAGLVVGFLVVAAGAYVGEAIQEKRERASLEAADEEMY